MVKVALLIGVSEYGADITSLLAATKDVEAMQRVLVNPEMGGFAETDITVLKNPNREEMADAIYTLFANRQREDLLLLYFSGHGIKDESGKLYLSNCTTRKENGKLVKHSAIAASDIHGNMNDSRSERQVVILDCCFSGAIARDMIPRDDRTVNLQEELGGRGRAILTSSTSTQYSFEQESSELSIYTHYLVEGIEKGAADKDGDGWISVDELHEYASTKVQQASPAMTPKIYPVEEGFKIYLAKAPKGDPKLMYRLLVQELAKEDSGEIDELDRMTLQEKQENLQLTLEEANAIEAEVLKPYQDYKRKLQKYRAAFIKAKESDSTLSERTHIRLKRLQEVLVLRNEDINPIEDEINKSSETISNHTAEIEETIINEQPHTPIRPDYARHPNRSLLPYNSNFIRYIRAYIIGGVIGLLTGGTVIYFITKNPFITIVQQKCTKEQYSLGDRISLGEEVLLKQDINPNKEAGVQAFANGNCQTAIQKFEAYRKVNRTDPETLIYLNNAKARQQKERLKIGVSVPIGTNPNIAREMLRGVAQAQDEINKLGGINGKALEVAIANDDNDSTQSAVIAQQFVQDKNILAVVGHNASDAAIPAAYEYKKGKLVMISPTSFDQRLSKIDYIFRTIHTNNLAENLSKYISNIAFLSLKKYSSNNG